MGYNDMVEGEDHMLGPSAIGITGKRACVARKPWADHIGEGKLLFQTPAVWRKYPLVEKTSGYNLEEKSGVESLKGCDAKL